MAGNGTRVIPALKARLPRETMVASWARWFPQQLGEGPLAAQYVGEPELVWSDLGFWTARREMRVESGTGSASFLVALAAWGDSWTVFGAEPEPEASPGPSAAP